MTVVEDAFPTDGFGRVGLPRETVASWLASGSALHGDYGRDAESFSRQWCIGAEPVSYTHLDVYKRQVLCRR